MNPTTERSGIAKSKSVSLWRFSIDGYRSSYNTTYWYLLWNPILFFGEIKVWELRDSLTLKEGVLQVNLLKLIIKNVIDIIIKNHQ